jgi:L-alanine-DL-glutamate epimerase-like enolase superfamily enzyme
VPDAVPASLGRVTDQAATVALTVPIRPMPTVVVVQNAHHIAARNVVTVASGASCSTRHTKKALANTTAITMLRIEPAIFSVLTDARLRRKSRKMRSSRNIGRRAMSRSSLCVGMNLAFPGLFGSDTSRCP